MKQKAMKQVAAELAAERARRVRDAELKKERAFSFDDVSAAQAAFVRAQYSAAVSGTVSAEEVKAAEISYLSALERRGFSLSDFEAAPLCAVCGDTGSAGGGVCSCVQSRYIAALTDMCGLEKQSLTTFDQLDSLPPVGDAEQAEALSKIRRTMRSYIEKYPRVNKRIILFTGKTGTGKTLVARAMVAAALERGLSALFLSAYAYNSLMIRCHVSPIAERDAILSDALSADMLVIDDLGIEPMTKNVTNEYLLLTLEERSRRGLITLITTNLTLPEIEKHYNGRIQSRCSDGKIGLVLEFTGRDLRLKA